MTRSDIVASALQFVTATTNSVITQSKARVKCLAREATICPIDSKVPYFLC